jgi:hypothetical protein
MLVLARRPSHSVLFPGPDLRLQVLDIEPAVHNRCRTLLVEDDGNERELLARLLRLNGCKTLQHTLSSAPARN